MLVAVRGRNRSALYLECTSPHRLLVMAVVPSVIVLIPGRSVWSVKGGR